MRRALAVALVALAALLGACGGSTSTKGGSDTNTTEDACAALMRDNRDLNTPDEQFRTDRAACYDQQQH